MLDFSFITCYYGVLQLACFLHIELVTHFFYLSFKKLSYSQTRFSLLQSAQITSLQLQLVSYKSADNLVQTWKRVHESISNYTFVRVLLTQIIAQNFHT